MKTNTENKQDDTQNGGAVRDCPDSAGSVAYRVETGKIYMGAFCVCWRSRGEFLSLDEAEWCRKFWRVKKKFGYVRVLKVITKEVLPSQNVRDLFPRLTGSTFMSATSCLQRDPRMTRCA
jgi:hypothetical protein